MYSEVGNVCDMRRAGRQFFKKTAIYIMVALLTALPFCAFLEPFMVNADEKKDSKGGLLYGYAVYDAKG